MPTVTIENRRFPSNTTIGPAGMYSLVDGSSNTFAADQYVTVPDPANPGSFQTYVFLFWNILGGVHSSNTVPVGDVGHNAFTAAAWYLLTGGGGDGVPHVSASAFSVGQNQVLAATPIDSVTPPGAWAGGNAKTVDTTGAAVVIDAENTMGAEGFDRWMVFGAGSAAGDDLSVPQNGYAIAIASYKEATGSTVPLPGLEIREVLDIFDRIRRHVGDWVSDPAPMDLARVLSRASRAQGLEAFEDELTKLTEEVGRFDAGQLEQAKATLDVRANRLRAAQRLVADAIKAQK